MYEKQFRPLDDYFQAEMEENYKTISLDLLNEIVVKYNNQNSDSEL